MADTLCTSWWSYPSFIMYGTNCTHIYMLKVPIHGLVLIINEFDLSFYSGYWEKTGLCKGSLGGL